MSEIRMAKCPGIEGCPNYGRMACGFFRFPINDYSAAIEYVEKQKSYYCNKTAQQVVASLVLI